MITRQPSREIDIGLRCAGRDLAFAVDEIEQPSDVA